MSFRVFFLLKNILGFFSPIHFVFYILLYCVFSIQCCGSMLSRGRYVILQKVQNKISRSPEAPKQVTLHRKNFYSHSLAYEFFHVSVSEFSHVRNSFSYKSGSISYVSFITAYGMCSSHYMAYIIFSNENMSYRVTSYIYISAHP